MRVGDRTGTESERETPPRKIQTQTLGEDATVATAAADAAGLVPADLERRVMAAVKASEARGDPPLLRAVELSRLVAGEGAGAGVGPLPSVELAGILVSNLCFAHNSPSLWKLLGQAVATRLVSPLHVLALLTPRVLPQRRAQPEAYRLYLELVKCHATSSLLSMEAGPNRDNVIDSWHISKAEAFQAS